MGKIKKKLKKIYHLYQKEGFKDTILITGAKCIYNMKQKPKIEEMKKSRPEVVKNRLVFCSNVDYSDNSRALSDYLVEQNYLKDHEIIWLVSNPDKFKEYERPNLKFVREKYKYAGLRTPESFMAVWTAEKVFFTHSMRWVKDEDRKEEQQFIDLWHGCGYKSAKGKSENIHFDYVLVPGEVFIDTKAEFFQCNKEKVLPIGYPRYDMMLGKSEDGKRYMDTFRDSKKNQKLIFWMPTYRMSHNRALSEDTLSGELNLPIIERRSDLNELNDICKECNTVLILKRHHLQSNYSVGGDEFSHIKYMDDENLEEAGVQLYDALPWVDALITDYSSVAIDYLLLDAPLAFTLDDYQQYKDSRGFVFEDPLKYMPGKHVYNKKEFFDFIGMISREEDPYKEMRSKVIAETHNPPRGSYCQRIAEYFHI